MKKYLLDYRGGCKGDFLCNYINFNEVIYDNEYKKSSTPYFNFKLDISHLPPDKIEKTMQQNISIIAGHHLHKLDKDLLTKYDRKIVKLCIEEKFYQTAAIELLIKNSLNLIDKFDQVILIKSNKLFKNVRYRIDCDLITNKLELNNKNRIEMVMEILKNMESWYNLYRKIKNDYPTLFKNFWYGDIFINKKYDILYELKPDFDPDHYENLLEQTWLPDVVNVFGYDINLRKYGYRDY